MVTSSVHSLQVWLKPSAEMSFLYGNNILKSGLGRITEHTPSHTGVVVLSMSDIPLGFGISGKSTMECRTADPSAIVVLHQADVGAPMSSCLPLSFVVAPLYAAGQEGWCTLVYLVSRMLTTMYGCSCSAVDSFKCSHACSVPCNTAARGTLSWVACIAGEYLRSEEEL